MVTRLPTQDRSILEIYDEQALEAASPQVKSCTGWMSALIREHLARALALDRAARYRESPTSVAM